MSGGTNNEIRKIGDRKDTGSGLDKSEIKIMIHNYMRRISNFISPLQELEN